MEDEILAIAECLNEVRKRIDDDLVFSKSIDLYILNKQEANKDKRTSEINDKKDNKMASYKQTALLKRLGYNGNMAELTIIEASKLIDSLMNKDKIANNDKDTF